MRRILFIHLICIYSYALSFGNRPFLGLVILKGESLDFDTALLSAHPSLRCSGCMPGILPEPGTKLNYTQIMFDHVQVTGAEEYLVEVALDKDGQTFEHPVVTKRDSSTAVMASNFEFGKKYTWRFTGLHNGKAIGWNGPYNFEIQENPFTDKTQFRVNVLQNDSLLNAGGLLVLDIAGSIIDRHGNVVWYLPWQPDDYAIENMQSIVNLKNVDMWLTPGGTITSINNHKALERDLRGNITWQAPRRSATYRDSLYPGAPYNYHHCFKKLQNGNYMVLDMEYLTLPDSLTIGTHLAADGSTQRDTVKVIIPYDIISEFDRQGNLVWSWRAKNYFDNLEQASIAQGGADAAFIRRNRDGHINAFDVDEKNGFVYAGFRNLNRVVKIDMQTRDAVCSWGDNMSYRGAKNGDRFFLRQHGANMLRDGSIAVFNNNPNPKPITGEAPVSSVVIFSQPDDNANSRIIWKYDCRFDTTDNMASVSGSVNELKNGNLLVCMGTVNRVFEVTRSKQVVWNALIESYNQFDSTWHKFPLYRAHYTSSLYPCYFTIQTVKKILTDGQTVFQLKIFNNGTEDDSYIVEASSASGNYKKQLSTAVLSAGKSQILTMNPELALPANAVMSVLVSSKTNPDFKRIVYLQK